MNDNIENPFEQHPSRWTKTSTTVRVNRCHVVLHLIILMIFLGIFFYMTYAYVKCNEPSSNLEKNSTSERLCTSFDCVRAASHLLESMDFQADPCEDFYQFTCGNFVKYHIRNDQSSILSWWNIVTERVQHAIGVFLESKPKVNESKALNQSRIMYKSCMNLFHSSSFCQLLVNQYMGMFLGDVIAMPNFLNTTKPKLLKTVENIRTIFNDLVRNSDWMDAKTKKAVIEKSQAMKVNIGFADFLLNKSKTDEYLKDLNLDENAFYSNKITILLLKVQIKSMNGPETTATEVNAGYFPDFNSLMIPMGILQFPFYGLGIEALNYGLGMSTISHEFSHGFDNYGRMFDKNGEKNDEWTNGAKFEYEKRTNCFVEQYSNFDLSEIDPTVSGRVNGENTLGENIADNVGLLLAYKTYKMFVAENGEEKILPAFQQFTHEQLFFIAYGNKWCRSTSPEGLELLKIDVHSPGKFRVNGVVSNSDEFRAAFKCKASSKMVSEKPCRIW